MVTSSIFRIIASSALSLAINCTSELAVDTKAVDVDCSQLDSASDLYLQCLVGESAKKNLQVTITTQTFTSSSTDIDIDWSEYPGALTYRLSLTEDKSCQKQISTFESSANAKRVSVTKESCREIMEM